MSIFDAIRNDNIKFVKKYIKDGGDLEKKNYNGFPLIVYAISNHIHTSEDKSNIHIAKLLIDAGCNINEPIYDIYDQLEYSYPINYVSNDCLKLLIESGCDINSVSSDGKTPIIEKMWWLSYSDSCSGSGPHMDDKYDEYIEFIKLLIESGCKLDIRDNSGSNYKDYLYGTDYYLKHEERIEYELAESFRIRYSKSSLIELCCYIVKSNKKIYKDRLHLLNRDVRILITS